MRQGDSGYPFGVLMWFVFVRRKVTFSFTIGLPKKPVKETLPMIPLHE